jgi:serine/threonine protein kinase
LITCNFSPPLDGIVQWELSLDRPLGSGATAAVFKEKIGAQEFALKIYHDRSSVEVHKLQSMIANPPVLLTEYCGIFYPRFGWVLSVITDRSSGEPIGFVMPVVDEQSSKTLDWFYDFILSKRLNSPISRALSFKLEILANLCEAIADLHGHGHLFIDLKPQNVRVYEGTNVVSLIDCDGYTISDRASGNVYRARMVSPDYIAPEIHNLDLKDVNVPKGQDEYALAVIIFQMINHGIHPFQGVIVNKNIVATTNDDKAALGLYPYSLYGSVDIKPSPSSIHETFLVETRKLFDRAFSTRQRPTAIEWATHLRQILASRQIVRCATYPNDIEHMRFKDHDCPSCLRAQTSLGPGKKNPSYTAEDIIEGWSPGTSSISTSNSSSSSGHAQMWGTLIFCVAIIASWNQERIRVFFAGGAAPTTSAYRTVPSQVIPAPQNGISDAKVCQEKSGVEALEACNRAISLDPTNPDNYLNRGVELAAKGDRTRAIEDYTRAITLKPDYHLAYFNRGISNERLGYLGLAASDFKSALKIKPDDAGTKNALSRVEEDIKKNTVLNNDKYMYQLIKEDRRLLQAWKRVFPRAHANLSWLMELSGTQTPVKMVTIGQTKFYLGHICMPRNCDSAKGGYLISVNGSEAHGVISLDSWGDKVVFFGSPDINMRSLLLQQIPK